MLRELQQLLTTERIGKVSLETQVPVTAVLILTIGLPEFVTVWRLCVLNWVFLSR